MVFSRLRLGNWNQLFTRRLTIILHLTPAAGNSKNVSQAWGHYSFTKCWIIHNFLIELIQLEYWLILHKAPRKHRVQIIIKPFFILRQFQKYQPGSLKNLGNRQAFTESHNVLLGKRVKIIYLILSGSLVNLNTSLIFKFNIIWLYLNFYTKTVSYLLSYRKCMMIWLISASISNYNIWTPRLSGLG